MIAGARRRWHRVRSGLEQRAWWQVASSVAKGTSTDQVTGLAAEMAFFGMLSVFPLTIAVAAGVGFLEPIVGAGATDTVREEVAAALRTGLPAQAQSITSAVDELFDIDIQEGGFDDDVPRSVHHRTARCHLVGLARIPLHHPLR